MQQVGLFGGTFDPIHMGHLQCAQQACEAFNLDRVLFVPVANPAFDKHHAPLSAIHRLEMCRLATQNNPSFEVSDCDVVRGKTTYSIDTVTDVLDTLSPDAELYFILGSDAAATLPLWHKAQKLSKLVKFIAVTRLGFAMSEELSFTLAQAGFNVSLLCVNTADVSSTQIRLRCARGESISGLCPKPVCEYILEHGLYREETNG